jgi:hypothetical protein
MRNPIQQYQLSPPFCNASNPLNTASRVVLKQRTPAWALFSGLLDTLGPGVERSLALGLIGKLLPFLLS